MCVSIILMLLALFLLMVFPIAGIIALLSVIGFIIVGIISSKGSSIVDNPPEGYDPNYVYPEKNKVKQCPYCKGNIKRDAIICSHCQKKVPGYDPNYVYPENNTVKQCPYCKENIKRDAIICPHCQKKLLF